MNKALIFYIFATCCSFAELLRFSTPNVLKTPPKVVVSKAINFAFQAPYFLDDDTNIEQEDDEGESPEEGFKPVPTGSSVSRMLAHMILNSVPKLFHLNEAPLVLIPALYRESFQTSPILSPMVSSQGPPV